MIVEDLEKQFFELKGKLDVGVVTEDEFKAAVSKLRFQADDGRWWMIGAQSGRWYSFDGARWIPGQPPREASTPPVEPLPEKIVEKVETPVAPPAETSTTPKIEMPASAKIQAPPPPHPEHIKLKRIERKPMVLPAIKPVSLPISGPLLIAGAALSALFIVIVFWIVLDFVLPNRPISSFLGQMLGGKSAMSVTLATATPNLAKDLPALIEKGDQLVLQSQIDSAIAQYQSAAQIAPQSAQPLTRLTRAYAFKGWMADAVNRGQLAVQRAPNDAEATAQFCRALTWNGQVNDALPICQKAVQLDDKNANAFAFLTEVYLLVRRPTDAALQAQTALQLAPQSAEAHRAMAWVLTVQGQKEPARAEWNQVIALEPDLYFRHYEYGEVLRVYFNEPANAVAEYQRALALYGGYTPTISRLGIALIAANKPQEAIAQLKRALTLEPQSADNSAYLGLAFGQANQCSQAIPYFEQALKFDANNALAQKGLADCKLNKAPTVPPPAPPQVPLTPPVVTPK
jgi:tetratricopeptide (TPR) repeat protein